MAQLKKVVSKQLGELLMERKIINQQQLQEALGVQKQSGGLIGQILVSLGYATEEQIAQVLTVQYGFPYLPLASYEIDQEALKTIPENVARQYYLIAIDRIGSTLTIAMANPLNVQAVEDIELMTKCKIQVFVSTLTDVSTAINKYYGKK